MKSLKDLVAESNLLENRLIESGGLITPEIEDLLTIREINLPEKIDNYNNIIDRFSNISDFYKSKAEFFLRMARAASQVSDKCLGNIKTAMLSMQIDEISGIDIRFKLQRSKSTVVIRDLDKLDGTYKTEIKELVADKKRILEDLELGIPVVGAELQENKSLRVYPNNKK